MAKVKITSVKIKNVDLEVLRKKAGLSLRELGKKSGINFGKISQIENGLEMSERTWNKLKEVLDKYNKK